MTNEAEQADDSDFPPLFEPAKFLSIELTNFLSFKHAILELDDFNALVGPNASGKSNAVLAFRLLRDIPTYGLPTALARHGGFDQLRHRSHGRPNDPAVKLRFAFEGAQPSYYELSLAAVSGKKYRVKKELAEIFYGKKGASISFASDGKTVQSRDPGGSSDNAKTEERSSPVAPGQSALSSGSLAGFVVYNALRAIQTVEINPALVRGFQEPSSTEEFDPTGANSASVFESLDPKHRTVVTERLAAIVPGIVRIEPRNFADQLTLAFFQESSSGNREFLAKQMSDGTLRAFAIMLALSQSARPRLLIIEEPEVAIHLGALQSLVEILQAETPEIQVLITTHSADIVDGVPLDSLRVVWTDDGKSHIARLSEHTRSVLKSGMITPGALLRADSLDPEAGKCQGG